MRDLKKFIFLFRFLICFAFIGMATTGCAQTSRSVAFFKDTEAHELAKAVENNNLSKIEVLVKENPRLLEVSSESGSNVLALSVHMENFQSFKKLLELGADPNFINPYTKYSILMESIKPYGNSMEWVKDNRFAQLLLKYGAEPNYAVEAEFTNVKGNHILASSPLLQASRLNLDMVKLLIAHKADYNQRVDGKTPFSGAVSSRKFEIIDYYIDSLNIDVREPMRVIGNDSLFIQDYLNRFMNYEEESEGYRKKMELIGKLESKGVDFKNYKYK
ncbi:ankyrin repeat domain-containing protein [Pontibacter virosus]|uniref:Uncharacterized protein n=1 Tax=Pontibacter virosus TaxID=1765052 RepID=A0A2U1AV39_9BACT|nr:ankyrin repeat domain-containing protein [Pontibacter virosus]PVY40263.1 hypothetical protein C8E01_108157 [Pontibacter virosus]